MDVDADYEQSVHWFKKSADQGNRVAQCFLGWIYLKGEHLPQNYAKVCEWLTKSAEQDYAYAQHYLGLLYQLNGWKNHNYDLAIACSTIVLGSVPRGLSFSTRMRLP